jgi:hypothetical protein
MLAVIDPQTGISTFGPESAENLANYDDLDDFDDLIFNPPIDADRNSLNDLSGYTQQVTVENVSASNFEQVVTDHSSHFVRVTVKVIMNSKEISSSSWLRARY